MDKKNKNPNVPNLRFSNNQLKDFKIVDICKLKQGNQYDLKQQFTEEKSDLKRFIRIVDYTQKTNDIRYVYSNGSENYVDCTDVVVVRYGASAGYVGRGINGIIANNLFTIRPINSALLNKSYLYHYLNAPVIQKQLNNTQSSGMPALNFQTINNLHILLPEYQEQRQIAVFLDKIDERIQTQIKIINSIESQIRAINNHIASDSTSSELNIASLFHVKTSNKLVESNTGKFCIVDMGTIDANGNYITGKYTDDETSLIPYGTLVMPKDDIGGGKIICKTMCINSSNKYALSDHVFALKLKNDKYNPVYFSALINSQYNNHKLKKLVTGSAQLGINQENLNRYKLKFSDSLELQNKYSEIIFRLNEELIIEKRLLDLFSSQKKYLLKNMFV